MDKDHQNYVPLMKRVRDYVIPYRGKFYDDRDSHKIPNWNFIYDSIATYCVSIGSAGFLSGLAGPGKKWANLTHWNSELVEGPRNKQYLYDCTNVLYHVLGKSNFYNHLGLNYEDTFSFGNGCFAGESDSEDVVKFHSFEMGEYRIKKDYNGNVVYFARHMSMDVSQIVEKFCNGADGGKDWRKVSPEIKDLYEAGQHSVSFDVRQMIYPNDNYNPLRKGHAYRKFVSCYWELGRVGTFNNSKEVQINDNRFLKVKGYDHFPVFCSSFDSNPSRTYSVNSPSISSLPDIQQLQAFNSDIMDQSEQLAKPTLNVPTHLDNQKIGLVAGENVYSDYYQGSNKIEPIITPNLNYLGALREMYMDIRGRIRANHFIDILMPFQGVRKEMTKFEAETISTDAQFILQKFIEQYNYTVFKRVIDWTFDVCNNFGLMPQAPEEMAGEELKVEFISPIARNQKSMGVDRIERFYMGMGNFAQVTPEIRHKLSPFETADIYAEAQGVPPELLNSNEVAAQKMQQEQQQQQAMMKSEADEQESKTAKNLAASKMDEENALTELTGGQASA